MATAPVEVRNPLVERVRKLREDLAAAEKALKDDQERRRARLDEQLRSEATDAGITAGKAKKTQKTCGLCGGPNHNARKCPDKKKDV